MPLPAWSPAEPLRTRISDLIVALGGEQQDCSAVCPWRRHRSVHQEVQGGVGVLRHRPHLVPRALPPEAARCVAGNVAPETLALGAILGRELHEGLEGGAEWRCR